MRKVKALFVYLLCLSAIGPAVAQTRVTGDADGNGVVATGDIFHTINHVFASGPAATGYGDVNGDAAVNQADVNYLVNHLYAGGPRPMEPWRLLEQATFGPTSAMTDHVRSIGFSAFLDEQFAATMSSYPSLTPMSQTRDTVACPNNSVCFRDNYSFWPLQTRFFTNAMYADDQLRQRMAFALHKLLVVSSSVR